MVALGFGVLLLTGYKRLAAWLGGYWLLSYLVAMVSAKGPDLRALARAFGLRAFTATDEATLNAALIGAQTAPGPALIDARIDPSGYRRMLEIVRGVPK